MRHKDAISAAILLLLEACSGGGGGGAGGGGIGTIPEPAPAPTNVTVTDLKTSQAFQNDAAGMKLALDLTTRTGVSGQVRPNSLTVSYDAGTRSYTISADGRSQGFGPAEIQTSGGGETIYQKTASGDRDYLTVTTTPYTSTRSNQYVGLAYWQHNVVSGTRQDMDFYVFTYGLPTAAAAVPRTGTAGFRTDMFGAVSAPGQEPRAFQGQGEFSIDFGAGVFSAHNYLTETSLVTGQSVMGGGIEFTGAGHLSASGFTGNALYRGWFGSAGGSLNGRFYGPNSEELGGAFSGSNGNGMTVVGGFTGQRDAGVPVENLTLTNLTRPQLFYEGYINNLVSQLNWQNSETFTYGTPTSDLYGGQFTINDKVASSDPNFTTYRKSFSSGYDTQDVTLRLYKPGNGNTELALTYASFTHYSTTVPVGLGRQRVDQYGGYGLATPDGLLMGKTGTGSYRGILHGTGRQYPSTVFYDVKGTSLFTVDFGAQNYTGALSMAGTASDGSGSIDFGSYDVAGRLTLTGTTGFLSRGGVEAGQFAPRFYGPDGEEIVAPFSVTAPTGAPGAGITIQGVAAARRQ
ncbi:MAG TPA: transferrin-binding protein-like solute binding protein [Sphingomonas sp.]|nr:transferrin-binding protein-like solute binding protein [Sphingomonas sp.]